MNLGPVEYIVVGFPGNQFNGDLVPALIELVESGTVAIIDLLIVSKDSEGNARVVEITEDDTLGRLFADLTYETLELFNDEDIDMLIEEIPDNTTAALMVWENVWATRFGAALAESGGILIDSARIPRDVALAALAYSEEEA